MYIYIYSTRGVPGAFLSEERRSPRLCCADSSVKCLHNVFLSKVSTTVSDALAGGLKNNLKLLSGPASDPQKSAIPDLRSIQSGIYGVYTLLK